MKADYGICYVAQGFPNPRGVRWESLADELAVPFSAVFGRSQFPQLGRTGGRHIHVPSLGPPARAPLASLHSALADESKRERIRVVWARDLLAGVAAYRLSRRLQAHFVLDICDAYPEVMRLMADGRRWWLPAAAAVADRIEAFLTRRADLVITTCPESISHLVGKHNLSEAGRRSFVSVENVPIESELSDVRRVAPAMDAPVRLCYVGSYDRGVRDLGTVVRGAEFMRAESGREWQLHIATFDRQEVEADLANAGQDALSRVSFVEPMPRALIPSFYASCDIGLVPHGTGPVLETTTSNKLFEYIAAGLPVLATANAPNVRVLNSVGGGLTYMPRSAEDFSSSLLRLMRNDWMPRHDTVWRSQYTWTAQSAPLRSRLSEMLSAPRT